MFQVTGELWGRREGGKSRQERKKDRADSKKSRKYFLSVSRYSLTGSVDYGTG